MTIFFVLIELLISFIALLVIPGFMIYFLIGGIYGKFKLFSKNANKKDFKEK